MIATKEITNQPLVEGVNSSNNNMVMKHRGKRTNENFGELERATPVKKRKRTRRVSWADKTSVRIQPDNRTLFKDYNDEDIWYTRRDYQNFLLDRLQTIELLRASGGDESAFNKNKFCVRGLEPFQSPDIHEELNSNRKFHQSTILIEQVRQSIYGLRNPERFRVMVGPQSEVAARRARELAAVDEHDVYGSVCRRGSLLVTMNVVKGTANASFPNFDSRESESMSLAERIRELQESNARRLIEIYAQPGYNPFRFPIRRDSLIGGGNSTVRTNVSLTNRFPIRRDSLTSIGDTTGLR